MHDHRGGHPDHPEMAHGTHRTHERTDRLGSRGAAAVAVRESIRCGLFGTYFQVIEVITDFP